jgi:hypothetical protein
MTTSHATGYFKNGEVEDYEVHVDNYPLTASIVDFSATLVNLDDARLQWTSLEDGSIAGYEIQKSTDGMNWTYLAMTLSDRLAGEKEYEYTDPDIPYGTTYYRLKFIGANRYSDIKSVRRIQLSDVITVRPNPVQHKAIIGLETVAASEAELRLFTSGGKQVYVDKVAVPAGRSEVELPVSPDWPRGIYILRICLNNEMVSRKLLIQ